MAAYLKKLSVNDGEDIFEMLQEIPKDENGLINGVNGMDFDSYKSWLTSNDNYSKGIGLKENMVPQSIYWLIVDGRLVGIGKLRHYLTEKLRKSGGHIGYAIRPSERGNKYGNLILSLLLEEAKKLDIEKVLLTIHNENLFSIKVALNNGGIVENKNEHDHHIWINL